MELLVGICGATVASLGLFCLQYRFNKTSLLSGMLFCCFVMLLGVTLVFFALRYPENPFLLYPLVTLTFVAFVAAAFGIYILIAFLLLNARTVFRKEGRSLANSLTLIAGIGITLFIVVSWFMVGQTPPPWLQALWAGILSVVFVSVLTVVLFLVTVLLCTLSRPRPNKDYLVVLGSGLIDGRVTPLLAGRIMRAVSFARAQKARTGILPTLIMSGGQGADEPCAEAEAMAHFAREASFDEDHILIESASSNTAENMAFSKAIMDARSPHGYSALYATSSYHVMRAGIFARKAGLRIDGLGARTAWYFLPNALLREFAAWIALHKRGFVLVVILAFLFSVTSVGLSSGMTELIPQT